MFDGRYINDPLLNTLAGSEKFPISDGVSDFHTTPSVVLGYVSNGLSSTYLSVNPRVFQTNFAASFEPNIDSYDRFEQTAVTGTVTINPPTGSARNFRYIVLRFTPTGSNQTLTWDSIYEAGNVTLPTTAPLGESTEIFLEYNSSATKWRCVGVNSGGGGSGSGTVNSGTALQLAYYASNGTAVSGLPTANSSVLITDGIGAPLMSQTLPSAVQSNITTVGTITSGAWNGSVIPGQYGGTGVNNAGKTITIGGNFSTVGAYTLALNLTANTSVTLPTTGTLSTQAGVENLTNKTIGAGSSYTGSSISTTYTDAKIKGSVAASSGVVLFGNGTADTATSSADFVYNSAGIQLSSSVNGDYETKVTNNNISGQANFTTVNNSGHLARFLKYGSSKGTYKIFTASTCGFYNQGSGDIALLNDFASGSILFSAGGSSSYHLSVASTGFINAASRVFVGGTTSPTALLTIAAGTSTVAPMRFTSASLKTSGDLAGDIQFLTDKLYATITTGTAVKEITLNDSALTSGTMPVATTNGRLTNSVISQSGTTVSLAGKLSIPVGRTVAYLTGTNAMMGTATLSGGTVTVSNTLITTTMEVLLFYKSISGTPGILTKGTVSAGSTFVVNSSDPGDNSTVIYILVETV